VALGMAKAPPSPMGFAPVAGDLMRRGVYYHKAIWAVAPTYADTVTITGRSLRDERELLRFYVRRKTGSKVYSMLRLPREGRRGWRYLPSTVLIPGRGCYAFRVTGPRLRSSVVFLAQ
jgi:hypothetical protein